jgi:hypothetical protein
MAMRTSAKASSGALPNAAQDFKSGTSATQARSSSDQNTMMGSLSLFEPQSELFYHILQLTHLALLSVLSGGSNIHRATLGWT